MRRTSGTETSTPLVRVARTGAGLASGLVVAAAGAWLLGIRPSAVLAKASAVSPWAIAGCAVSGLVVLALQTLRWHQVMRPLLGIRYGEAFCAQAIGMMLNALLPARGGDLLRAQYLGRLTGTSRATILGTEVVDRWLDWWGWIPVVALLALTSRMPPWIHVAVAVFGGALATSGIAIVVICRRRSATAPGSRLAELARAFRAGLDAFASRRTLVLALVVAPLPWLWEAAALALSARAFDLHLTFSMAVCVLVGFNAAMIIPAPGGVGAVETGGTAVLVLFGVNQAAALAFLVVYHLTQLLPTIALGATMLALRPRPAFTALNLDR